MGDRAPAEATILSCPPEHHETVRALLDEWGLNYIDWVERASDELVVGERYTHEEVSISVTQDLGPKLRELGCTFIVHQSAKYEWDACVAMGHPDHGYYDGDANEDGDLTFTATKLDELIDTHAEDPTALVAALNELTQRALRESVKEAARV